MVRLRLLEQMTCLDKLWPCLPAGHAAALRLPQVPVFEDEADRVRGQDAGHQDRRSDGHDPGGGV